VSSEARAARPRLWVFNLDAEIELGQSANGYQSPRRVLDAIAPLLPAARRLMAPGDACLEEAQNDGVGERVLRTPRTPWLGAAWCPTPSALRRLARAGAELPPCPSPEVLRRVTHRRFYLELGGGAPGARYVSDEAELGATLNERRVWLFKRPYGFAGRGQRRIPLAPSKDDRRWLADGLRLGGLLAEPWLQLAGELAIHGLLDAHGRLALGDVCLQKTNDYRAWVETRRAAPDELPPADVARLRQHAVTVGEALSGAGYFGPFGIDAYYFESSSSTLALNPLGEVNARYTMGFPIGNPQLVPSS